MLAGLDMLERVVSREPAVDAGNATTYRETSWNTMVLRVLVLSSNAPGAASAPLLLPDPTSRLVHCAQAPVSIGEKGEGIQVGVSDDRIVPSKPSNPAQAHISTRPPTFVIIAATDSDRPPPSIDRAATSISNHALALTHALPTPCFPTGRQTGSSMASAGFFEALEARVKAVDSLLCVGLDPHAAQVRYVCV